MYRIADHAQWPLMSNAAPQSSSALEKRDKCGPQWMPVSDVTPTGGGAVRTGFSTAVDVFCKAADTLNVPAGGYLSYATTVWLDKGKDPATSGVSGFAYFEVHNSQKSGGYTIGGEQDSCPVYQRLLT